MTHLSDRVDDRVTSVVYDVRFARLSGAGVAWTAHGPQRESRRRTRRGDLVAEGTRH